MNVLNIILYGHQLRDSSSTVDNCDNNSCLLLLLHAVFGHDTPCAINRNPTAFATLCLVVRFAIIAEKGLWAQGCGSFLQLVFLEMKKKNAKKTKCKKKI